MIHKLTFESTDHRPCELGASLPLGSTPKKTRSAGHHVSPRRGFVIIINNSSPYKERLKYCVTIYWYGEAYCDLLAISLEEINIDLLYWDLL